MPEQRTILWFPSSHFTELLLTNYHTKRFGGTSAWVKETQMQLETMMKSDLENLSPLLKVWQVCAQTPIQFFFLLLFSGCAAEQKNNKEFHFIPLICRGLTIELEV